METFEGFDEEYNETIAILQVTKRFSKIFIKNNVQSLSHGIILFDFIIVMRFPSKTTVPNYRTV